MQIGCDAVLIVLRKACYVMLKPTSEVLKKNTQKIIKIGSHVFFQFQIIKLFKDVTYESWTDNLPSPAKNM